jgi:hypothetical protein
MKSTKKVKDLNQFLTEQTGLNKLQREHWRQAIVRIMKTDKVEAMKIFNSFEYFKVNYLNKKK